jgi:cyanocobalamin reductase (cyanide-eliminating) / alkylcobalamin dealkylase
VFHGLLPPFSTSLVEVVTSSTSQVSVERKARLCGAGIESHMMDRIVALLAKHGFDIVKPFNTLTYNKLVKPRPDLIDLPVNSLTGEGLPALLVGNSKVLWPHFLEYFKQHSDEVNPLDCFVRVTMNRALLESFSEVEVQEIPCFYSDEIAPHRLIAFQKLAHACGLARLDESTHLCVHPKFGPWIALRVILILPPDSLLHTPKFGLTITEVSLAEESIDRARLLLERALQATCDGDKDAWRLWVEVRDCIDVGREYRYSDEQIQYHYTKIRDVLVSRAVA